MMLNFEDYDMTVNQMIDLLCEARLQMWLDMQYDDVECAWEDWFDEEAPNVGKQYLAEDLVDDWRKHRDVDSHYDLWCMIVEHVEDNILKESDLSKFKIPKICDFCFGKIEQKYMDNLDGERVMYWDSGHNGQPLVDGRVCDSCNELVVAYRIKKMMEMRT